MFGLFVVAFCGLVMAGAAFFAGRFYERGETNILGPAMCVTAFLMSLMGLISHIAQ